MSEQVSIVEASRDRWRARAKSAQAELSDLRASLGLQGEWTPDDSIGVYRYRAEQAEARLDEVRAAVMQGGQTPDIRCKAVMRALDDPHPSQDAAGDAGRSA